MPPDQSLYPRATSESAILLPVFLPLLGVLIVAVVIVSLIRNSLKSPTTGQRPRQPALWPASLYQDRMPVFSSWWRRGGGAPAVPGRDFCPDMGRGSHGFWLDRWGPRRHTRLPYSGYGDVPSRRSFNERGRWLGRADREHRRRNHGQFANLHPSGMPGNYGSGEILDLTSRSVASYQPVRLPSPVFNPRNGRYPHIPSDSDPRRFRRHARRSFLQRGPEALAWGRGVRGMYNPAYGGGALNDLRTLDTRRPHWYDPPLNENLRHRDARYLGVTGGEPSPYPDPRYHPAAYDGGHSSDESDFDLSEDTFSEGGHLSHSSSPYPGHYRSSSGESDLYTRRYSNEGAEFTDDYSSDPSRMRSSLPSDESTYSDGYGGYHGPSTDPYESSPY